MRVLSGRELKAERSGAYPRHKVRRMDTRGSACSQPEWCYGKACAGRLARPLPILGPG